METFPRFFTLAQANQLLEILRPLVADMMEIRDRILTLQPQLEPVINKAVNNGGSLISVEALAAFESLKTILDTIQQYDVFVKDVNTGLIDFPSIRGEEVVYLCWQFGEEEIRYWHELEDGYAGRRPL